MRPSGDSLRAALALGLGLAAFTYLEGRWGAGLPGSGRGQHVAAFYVRYLLTLGMTLAVHRAVPARFREGWLLLASALFLLAETGPGLPAAMAAWTLFLGSALRLPPGPVSQVGFAAALVGFFTWVSSWALEAPAGQIREFFLRPSNLLAMGVLLKSFKRSVFAWFESRTQDLGEVPFTSLGVYLAGLQFLLPFSVTPSLRRFLDSRSQECAARGVATTLTCLGYAALWLLLASSMRGGAGPRPGQGGMPFDWRGAWFLITAMYVSQLIFRLGTEQLSVGVSRLFGYDLPDNFERPLLARGPVDFWRRWNLLWREFLLAAAYYPVLLSLGRRFGPRRPWIFVAASSAAFGLSAVFNILPALLFLIPLGTFAELPILVEPWIVYDGLMGLLVGGGLAVRARYPDFRWPAWTVPAQVGLAFLVIAFLRVLTYLPTVPLSMRLDMMRRALGL